MWRIGFLVWVSCLSTQICGQSSSPPQITGFLSHDLVKPDEVKFARRFDASQNWGFRLPCEASGAHSLQWRWQHNGTDIVYGAKYKLGDDGSLTGEYLVAENSGNYQCFVRDTVTAKEVFSRRLKVAVTYVGDFASKVNETLTIDLGQSLRVQCPQRAPNYGASYSWESKNGTPFKRDHHRVISPDGELFIMYVTQKDVDEIASLEGIGCTITGGDTIYRSGLLTLKKRALYDPETKMSPSWRVLPSSETATQGKKQTLYCLAVGRPPPRITWKKHGQQITHGWNSFEIPDAFYGRLLNIISVRRDLHQDVYTCEAENSQNSGNPLVYTINLNVEVPPRWTGDTPPPTKKNIDIGGNARLLCNAVADPRPSYKWYKDGSRITSSSSNVKEVNDTLELKNVRLQEDGVYQCVAENRVGMIVSYTWVHVRALPPTFVEFGPFYLYKDREARLKCQPDAAPRPTIWWYKGGSEITTGARYKVESDGTLVIDKVNKQDAGQYQCRAQNILGEASANASAYVLEVPYPPTNLQITDTCHNRTTTLSWVTRSSNDAPIKYFLVEQESNHEPNVFRLIYNVTNPNATSIRLNLTGWATLRFRMMAITSLGSSRPSLPTEEGVCSTSLGAPDKFPGNLRGESKKSEELNITWTPLPKIDWNAPGLYYILQYRRVTDKPPVWEEENITDPTVGMFTVQEPGHCELWEFQICAANDKGLGPFSAIEQSIFGLHTPKGKPENVTVDKITIHSVNVSWAPVADSKEGGFDGYRIYYWRESRFVNGKRRRRDIPSYAYFTNVTGGKTHQTTVYGLKPDTNYKLVIKAFSCGGAEGPASDEVTFSTLRAVSTGRPSKTPTDSATLAGSAAPKGSAPRQCHAFFSRVIVFGLSFSNILYHF